MKNSTLSLPSELSEALSNREVKTVTFSTKHGERLYTFAPALASLEFMERFPNHVRLSGLLSSSGSSWAEKAFIFFLADCFDPPLYVQFGSSYEDAYESFCDNHPDLLIPESDLGDYGYMKDEAGNWQENDSPEHSFNSDGQPIDTDNLQSFAEELTIEAVTF